jgi:hypothetical protein
LTAVRTAIIFATQLGASLRSCSWSCCS